MKEKSFFGSLTNSISKIWNYYVTALISEFPLFLSGIMLLGGVALILNVFSPKFEFNFIQSAIIIVRIGLLVMHSTIIVIIVYATHKRWIKIIVYIFLLAAFATDRFLEVNFNLIFDAGIVVLLADTNSNEASEFLKTFFLTEASVQCYIEILIAIIAVVAAEYGRKQLTSYLSGAKAKIVFTTICLLMGLCGIYGLDHYIKKQTFRGDFVTRGIHSVVLIHDINKKIEAAIQSTRALDGEQIFVNSTDSVQIVLVIGESFIKDRSSLYGYTHQTNPLLEQELKNGNLFVFKDVISPYSRTSEAIKDILCCNDLANREYWYDFPYVPAIFHKCGYNVTIWDNQRNMGVGQNNTLTLNAFIYDSFVQKVSYDFLNQKTYRYDLELVEELSKLRHIQEAPSLAIVHLMGQHFEWASRFPDKREYNYFTIDSVTRKDAYLNDEKKQYIANYDNATRYNDMVMHRIIDLYRNNNAVIVYLSDHGEECFDYRDSQYRKPDRNNFALCAKYQYSIPFMIWCSDKYMAKHQSTVACIECAVNQKFTSDRLCQLMLNLGHIVTRYYKPERDILNPKWKECKRYIYDVYDGRGFCDYDSIMNQATL